MVATARWMYSNAIERRETRGMHKHLDYPEQDTNQQHYLISGGLDRVWVEAEPLGNVETRHVVSGVREDFLAQNAKVKVGVAK